MMSHRAALEQRHARLESELRAELARPMPDALRVSEIKRAKLALRDQMKALDRRGRRRRREARGSLMSGARSETLVLLGWHPS